MQRIVPTAKRVSRRAVDRVMLPYFADLRRDLAGRKAPPADPAGDTGAGPGAVPSDFFHNALHELRTIELQGVRKGARSAVSVGASGGWYFHWFEANYGELDRHVGVEAFEPRPADLPSYAEWIESTADRFPGVEDDSIDLVFAGQTTEHLWASELVGFLTESARVLPEGGLLVADSPNRLVTEHLDWSHGGHTIELAVSEWTELVELAGFRVLRSRGAWLCRQGARIMQLEDHLDDGSTVVQRISSGGSRPDDSFIWWVDAERIGTEPDESALADRINALFQEHWNTRISRGMWPGPGARGPQLLSRPDRADLIDSLPIMLHPGTWELRIRAEEGSLDSLPDPRLQLCAAGGEVNHDVSGRRDRDGSVVFTFEQADLMLALTLRLDPGPVTADVRLQMPVSLSLVSR